MTGKYSDPFQGDPKLHLTPSGSDVKYVNGQPIMDRGLENWVLMSLLTRQGWCGNALIDDPANQVGSDFEAALEQPITLDALNDIRDAAAKALQNPVFGDVSVEVANPEGWRIEITILIEPPGQDARKLLITRNGDNWIAQTVDPAYRRV